MKSILIATLVIWMFICSIFLVKDCRRIKADITLVKHIELKEDCRFNYVADTNAMILGNRTVKGTIYKDNITGIEYLYMWVGGVHGGPVMIRLWEK